MNDLSALAGSATAQQYFENNQVNLFLFDLKNEANEHGFKSGVSWMLQLVTEQEMIGLKRQYHPVIALRLQPVALLKVFRQVKNRLQQTLSEQDQLLTTSDLQRDDKSHLAAYPVKIACK